MNLSKYFCQKRIKFAIMRDLQTFTEVCKQRYKGRVAQSVEQRIENPRVGSSILPPATI
jgi:hypothetical protein